MDCDAAMLSIFSMRFSQSPEVTRTLDELGSKFYAYMTPSAGISMGAQVGFHCAVHRVSTMSVLQTGTSPVGGRCLPCGLRTALEARVLQGCAKTRHVYMPPSTGVSMGAQATFSSRCTARPACTATLTSSMPATPWTESPRCYRLYRCDFHRALK